MSSEPLIRPGLSTAITKDLPNIKAELRAKVPHLGLRDIQIRTLPYQEVLRNDLCKGCGYGPGLELFNEMMENDGKSFETKKFHELNDDVRVALTKLVEGLRQAEDATSNQLRSKLFLDLALLFETVYETFPWTTKELFETALSAAMTCTEDDNNYQQTLIQYHYANFLMCKERAHDVASIKIQAALELARGKNEKWSRSENDESTSLIKSVMLLYFKIFLQKARQMTMDDAHDKQQEAQQIAMNVMALIDDSLEEPMAKARCHMEYGDFLQTNKLFVKAIDAYLGGVGEANKVKDVAMQSTGLFSIANCYKQVGNVDKAEKYAKRLLELSEQEQQHLWKAESLLLLAEISPHSNLDQAIHYAEQAFVLFQSAPLFPNRHQKINQARLIVGKLKADKLYPIYLRTVYMSEMGSRSHFFHLLNWQISRKFPEA